MWTQWSSLGSNHLEAPQKSTPRLLRKKKKKCHGSVLSRMAGQYSCGEGEVTKVEGVCRFYRFEKSLPKGPLSNSLDSLVGWCYGWTSSDELSRCLSRESLDTISPVRPGKTAFLTTTGNYHYQVMPFSLKNAGSTYQRMVTRMLESQLRENVEAYIDDMVVKSKLVTEHLSDLEVHLRY